MNAQADLNLDFIDVDSNGYRLLTSVKIIDDWCSELKTKGITIKFQADEMDKWCIDLSKYIKCRDLEYDFKIIEALEPSPSCTLSSERIKKKLNVLSADIQEFHQVYGSTADELVSIFMLRKHFKDSERPVKKQDYGLVDRFCSHVKDVIEIVTDLNERLQTVREMIQPTKDVAIREYNPIDQLENIYMNQKLLCVSYKRFENKEDLTAMRKDIRKVNQILREAQFELSQDEYNRFRLVKRLAATKQVKSEIVIPSYGKLKLFGEHLEHFQTESQEYCLSQQQKCMIYEQMFQQFKCADSGHSNHGNLDVLVAFRIAFIFEDVFIHFKQYTSNLESIKMELDSLCDQYL